MDGRRKLKIVQINREERQKTKNITKKIKHRWDNARRFEKESLGPGGANIQAQKTQTGLLKLR